MSRLVKQRATGYIFSLSSYRPHLRILGACQVPSLTGSQGSETLRQDDKRTTRKGHYIHRNAILNMYNNAWINMYKFAFILHTSLEVTSHVYIIKCRC